MPSQVQNDFDRIQLALEHALTYPSRSTMADDKFNQAHGELLQALEALKRIRRVKNGSIVGTSTNFHDR